MTPIIHYIKEGKLPLDKQEARYVIINDNLYRRSHSGPYLRCLDSDQALYVMKEIHEGDCGNHSGPRSLIHKMLRQGFYWPTMKANTESLTKMCDSCQRFALVIHSPSELLSLVSSPNSFMKLTMDIVEPLSLASGQRKVILAITDYYSKWVEADAFTQVKEKDVVNFVWKEVIYQFKLPKEIVANNGTQFSSDDFEDFCNK